MSSSPDTTPSSAPLQLAFAHAGFEECLALPDDAITGRPDGSVAPPR
ncbi:hypothetical protein [Streptomyces thermospinosisporus]